MQHQSCTTASILLMLVAVFVIALADIKDDKPDDNGFVTNAANGHYLLKRQTSHNSSSSIQLLPFPTTYSLDKYMSIIAAIQNKSEKVVYTVGIYVGNQAENSSGFNLTSQHFPEPYEHSGGVDAYCIFNKDVNGVISLLLDDFEIDQESYITLTDTQTVWTLANTSCLSSSYIVTSRPLLYVEFHKTKNTMNFVQRGFRFHGKYHKFAVSRNRMISASYQSIFPTGIGGIHLNVSHNVHMVWVFHNPDPQNGCHFTVDVQLIGKKGSSCEQTQFSCENGQCIPEYQRCNSNADCEDGSDEMNCHGPCSEGLLRCDDGSCVTGERCNGQYDCRDYSDELDCSDGWKLSILSGTLSNGRMIYEVAQASSRSGYITSCTGLYIKLTGKPDPSLVQATMVRVGLTVYKAIRFDRFASQPKSPDCSMSIMSTKHEGFKCRGASYIICIPEWRRCDGQPHCTDKADEKNCQTISRPVDCALNGMFWCASKQMWTPDVDACHNKGQSGPDTTTKCLSSEISCDAGTRCYSYHEACDGISKCFDRADERDCNQDTEEDGPGSIFTVTIVSFIVLFMVLFAIVFKRVRSRMQSSCVFYSAPCTTEQITADNVQLHTFAVSTEDHDSDCVRGTEQRSPQVIWNANYAGEVPQTRFQRNLPQSEGRPGMPVNASDPPPSYEEAVYNQSGRV